MVTVFFIIFLWSLVMEALLITFLCCWYVWCEATLWCMPNGLTNALQLLTSAQGHQPKGQQVLWRWDSWKGREWVSWVSPRCQCACIDVRAQILIMEQNASITVEGSRLQPWDAPSASNACFEAECWGAPSEWKIPWWAHNPAFYSQRSHGQVHVHWKWCCDDVTMPFLMLCDITIAMWLPTCPNEVSAALWH